MVARSCEARRPSQREGASRRVQQLGAKCLEQTFYSKLIYYSSRHLFWVFVPRERCCYAAGENASR